jgi:Transglutaminase-like superfamily
MMRTLFLLMICCCAAAAVKAQPGKYQGFAVVDSFIAKLKVSDTVDVYTLTDAVTRPFSETSQKVRAIYSWITRNIAYDCIAFRSRSKRKDDAFDVLRARKGVGEGYANLFAEMCSAAKIRSITVPGYLRSKTDDIGNFPAEVNHTWNVVQIGSQWRLIDCTLGSGFTDRQVRTFTRQFSDAYFFSNPKIFAYSHMPTVDAWQLGGGFSKSDFKNAPILHGGAFTAGLNGITPGDGVIKTKPKENITFQYTLGNADAIDSISVRIGDEKRGKITPVEFVRTGSGIRFYVKPDKGGNFPLSIFFNNKMAVEYMVEVGY